MKQDDPKSTSTVTVGILSGIILLLVIFLLQIYFYKAEQSLYQVKAGTPEQAAQALRVEQEGTIEGGYFWLDEEQGVVALPIERAMERVVEKSRAGEDG